MIVLPRVIVLLCLIGLQCCAHLVFAADVPLPNIVLINVDDLGINDLGCYGRKEHDTPNLDRLASQGLRFTSAYCAQPICSPSRAALLSGKAPARLHLTTFLPGRRDAVTQQLLHPKIELGLPLSEMTLPEYLLPLGYRTGCFGKWHLGNGTDFSPVKQGFETVSESPGNTKPSATEGGKGEYELTNAAIKFVVDHQREPFLLYLAHNTPHIPLAAKPELIAKYAHTFNPTYAALIHSMDDAVGLLLKKLDELQLTDRTIVIFISDNGGLHVPELSLLTCPPTYNRPYRAGKGYLYEGGLRVPLIIRWPGRIKPGQVDLPIINTDLLPTLVEIAGGKLSTELDGISHATALQGQTPLKQRPLFWHFPHYNNQGGQPAGAMRDGDWKLIEHYASQKLELYNLAQDVGETKNLAAQEPERAQRMQGALAAWRQSVAAQTNSPNPDYDPAAAKVIYVDHDSSQLQPEATALDTAEKWKVWRQAMDAAVQNKQKKPAGPAAK